MRSSSLRRAIARPRYLATGLSLAVMAVLAAQPAQAHEGVGAVYVLSNQAKGNEVRVYRRAHDGALSFEASVPTGGTGTITPPPPNGAPGIDPLGSQGSVVYSDGLLFAVNAGSNDVSMFADDGQGLRLLDRVPSGGDTPTSIAVRGNLVYVLNAAGTPNITALRIDSSRRRLLPLDNGTTDLPGGSGAAPAEVLIEPFANIAIVTEKGTNLIDTFRITASGRAVLAASSASVGNTPFGFSIGADGTLAVADAAAGAVSSYEIRRDGTLGIVSGAVSLNGQTAPCWLVTTPGGHLAFTGNAGTQSISSLSISDRGDVVLLDATAAHTPGAALDLGMSSGGRYLYVRSATGTNAALPGSVSGYRVGDDGSLTPVNSLSDVPAGAQGIAVR